MVKRLNSLALMCLLLTSVNAQTPVEISADPADGSTVEKLSSIVLTFVGADEVDKGSKASNVTITSDQGYSAGATLDYGTDANQMVVSFTEVSADGLYTLDFPADAFTSTGATIPAFQLTYRIGQEPAEGLLIAPSEGTVTWLSDITIKAAAAPDKGVSTTYGAEQTIKLLAPDGNEVVADVNSIYDSSVGYSTLHVTPRLLITTPGEYTLVVPDGYLYYQDADYNRVELPGATLKYNVLTGEQQAFTSVPSKDQAVSQFQTLTITFPGATTVKKNSSRSIVLYQDAETWKGSGSLDYNFTYEANTMTYSVYSPIIDAGHYTMNFPEGCLLIDDAPCAPFMVEFDIVENEPLNMVVTPAEGASVDGILNSAVITFPDCDDVTYNPSSITLYQAGDTHDTTIGSAYGTQTTVKQDDGKTFVVNFPGIATQSGNYYITIPKNAFSAGDRYNAETKVSFTYTAPEAATFAVTPAPESTLDRVQDFTISFAGDEEVTVNTSLTSASVQLYKGIPHKNEYGYLTGGSQLSSLSLDKIQKVEGKKGDFTLSFPVPGVEKDDYALIIPAGIFLVAGRTYSQTDTLIFRASGEGVDKIEATPALPVKTLKNISLTFVNETSVQFQTNYASASLYRCNPEADYDTYVESISASKSDWSGYVYIDETQPNKLNIELLNEVSEAGEYYIQLTTYFLYMSDGTTPNTVNKVYFTVDPTATAIQSVEQARQQDDRIYTVSGTQVQQATRPGLYIRNGKKLLVK